MIALTRLVVACLAFLLAHSVVIAAEAAECRGEDLIEKLGRDDPQQARELYAETASLAYSKGLLWQVMKPGGPPSWIFGTIHLSDPRVVELPASAEAAFRRSKILALEVTELLDKQEMAKHTMAIMKFTTYPEGASLEGKVSPPDQALLSRQIESKTGLPWSVARKMRPWALMGMVTLPDCELARKRAGKPFLDMALGQRAKADGKTIVGLETLDQQMAIMASLPEPLVMKAMVEAVALGDVLDDVFETMIARYEEGELGLIWSMLHRIGPDGFGERAVDPFYAQFQSELVDKRNIGMADASEALIEKGGAFIAVGALHLPGDKGLLNLLVKRGYEVSRP